MLVEELAKTYQEANPYKRPTTVATESIAIQTHTNPVLGKLAIGSIGVADIQALINGWSAKGLAPRTVIRMYGVVRAVFNYAVQNDLLGRSPCRAIKLPKVTSTRRRDLTPQEVDAIMESLPPEYRAMVAVGAVLGLRWGEVAGLRVGRVDVLGRRLTVLETAGRDAKGKLVLGPPKSAASMTTLTMPKSLADQLADHMASVGLTGADTEALLFPNAGGGAWLYSNWRNKVWLPALKQAGLEGVGFHDLRRACATMLVARGVDIKTAQARLRHADPRMTLGLYAAAEVQADRDAADLLGDEFLVKPKEAKKGNGAKEAT